MDHTKKDLKTGIKYDEGKPRYELLPWECLHEIAKVLTKGSLKYEDHNWKKVPDGFRRYEGALLRHLSAYERGEKIDPETGLSHITHAACNALFMIYFDIKDET